MRDGNVIDGIKKPDSNVVYVMKLLDGIKPFEPLLGCTQKSLGGDFGTCGGEM